MDVDAGCCRTSRNDYTSSATAPIHNNHPPSNRETLISTFRNPTRTYQRFQLIFSPPSDDQRTNSSAPPTAMSAPDSTSIDYSAEARTIPISLDKPLNTQSPSHLAEGFGATTDVPDIRANSSSESYRRPENDQFASKSGKPVGPVTLTQRLTRLMHRESFIRSDLAFGFLIVLRT